MTNASTTVACRLSEPDLQDRKELLRKTLAPFLTQSTYTAGTSQLVFSKPDVTRKMLESMIVLERECCPFFTIDLTESSAHFHLAVTGPEGSENMVRDFFSADDDAAYGCCGSNKRPLAKRNYVFGFITLCAVGCAVSPTLAALGLIGVATGAYVGMWMEVAVAFAILLGSGLLFARYVKKKRSGVPS